MRILGDTEREYLTSWKLYVTTLQRNFVLNVRDQIRIH